jgi:hypothetical protein
MLAVSFCRCDCGIEMKLLQKLDDTMQAYTCNCGQEFEFLGTIVDIYTASANRGFAMSADWKQVSGMSLKASA